MNLRDIPIDKPRRIMKLTKEHIDIMEHTRDRAAQGFYCGDSPEMQELVAAGLMAEAGRKSFVPDPYFTITRNGREALRKPDELTNE